MAAVIKATIDLFDQIYPLLTHFEIPDMAREQWFSLLNTRWSKKQDHFGYVLMEGDMAVGFLGGFFHERQFNGSEHSFCNLFGWYVIEEYRQQSLLLLLEFLKLPETTITSLTPSREATLILQNFRFIPLETRVTIFPLLPGRSSPSNFEISRDREIITSRLNPRDMIIFRDHDLPQCSHLIVFDSDIPDEYCYVVFNRTLKRRLHFTQVHYISDFLIFRKAMCRIQSIFLRHNRTLLTVMDRRLANQCRRFPCFDYRLRYPRLYRPATPDIRLMDNLYTELVFLKTI